MHFRLHAVYQFTQISCKVSARLDPYLMLIAMIYSDRIRAVTISCFCYAVIVPEIILSCGIITVLGFVFLSSSAIRQICLFSIWSVKFIWVLYTLRYQDMCENYHNINVFVIAGIL